MLAGAAGLPLLPVTAGGMTPPGRRIFMYEPREFVDEIVAMYLSARLQAPVMNARALGTNAASFLTAHEALFGLVYFRGDDPYADVSPAALSSGLRREVLPDPFTARQLTEAAAKVTGWDIDRQNRTARNWPD